MTEIMSETRVRNERFAGRYTATPMSTKWRAIILGLAASLAACSPHTLRVTEVQIGRTLNADETVGITATTFGPTDTVYIAVLTSGIGSATIGVRWKFGDRLVNEASKQVSYKDRAATDFSLKGAAGIPPGDYTAEVSFDGKPVETKTFRVVK
jgi:hypothetical protein